MALFLKKKILFYGEGIEPRVLHMLGKCLITSPAIRRKFQIMDIKKIHFEFCELLYIRSISQILSQWAW
jgi:hypothetical protein